VTETAFFCGSKQQQQKLDVIRRMSEIVLGEKVELTMFDSSFANQSPESTCT